MGLDMYLYKKIYIGANYEHNEVKGSIKLTKNNKPIKVELSKVTYIVEQLGYWRKANQIHNWFVTNVQDNVDNCQEFDVPIAKLIELRDLCKKVLKTKKTELLEPKGGFFFGGTNINGYYWQDLKDTIKILSKLDEDCEYCYQSSW
jgi:hypothetical protein